MLVYSKRAGLEGSVILLDLSLEYTRWKTKCLPLCMDMSVNDNGSALSIDLGITNKFQKVGEFTNTESMDTENHVSNKNITQY